MIERITAAAFIYVILTISGYYLYAISSVDISPAGWYIYGSIAATISMTIGVIWKD